MFNLTPISYITVNANVLQMVSSLDKETISLIRGSFESVAISFAQFSTSHFLYRSNRWIWNPISKCAHPRKLWEPWKRGHKPTYSYFFSLSSRVLNVSPRINLSSLNNNSHNMNILISVFFQRPWLRESWMHGHKPTGLLYQALHLQGCSSR